jgi:hypothetical protein
LLSEPFTTTANGGFAFFGSDRYLIASPGFILSMPPQSGHKPVPEWLLRLATTVAGGEIERRGIFHEQVFDAKVYDDLRRELATLPDDAPYVEWGRWFLSDRATRSVAPGFTITPAEAAKLAAELAAPAAAAPPATTIAAPPAK